MFPQLAQTLILTQNNYMGDTILIDRIPAILKFSAMLEGNSGKRILRIIGTAKMGKSRLLREYKRLALEKEKAYCVLVDLKSKFQNYEDILFQVIRQLSWLEFKNYLGIQQQIIDSNKVEVKGLNLLWSAVSINLANTQSDSIDGQNRQRLTSAFCQDLIGIELKKPLIIQFDSFDSANPKIQDWVLEQLIPSLLQISLSYIVIAGRTLPEEKEMWVDYCDSYLLQPVTLQDHITYCNNMGIQTSEDVIKAFHNVFDGIPGLFAEYANKLKKEEG